MIGARKAAMVAASKQEDHPMYLITAAQLEKHSQNTLNSMFLRVSHELAQTEEATVHRTAALASLENISHAMRKRRMKGPGF